MDVNIVHIKNYVMIIIANFVIIFHLHPEMNQKIGVLKINLHQDKSLLVRILKFG